MIPVAGAAVSLFLVVGIAVGGGMLLYAMVRSEHDNSRRTDRASGERMARRDTDDRE